MTTILTIPVFLRKSAAHAAPPAIGSARDDVASFFFIIFGHAAHAEDDGKIMVYKPTNITDITN